MEKSAEQIFFKANNSKSHYSAKIHQIEKVLKYAQLRQLGMELIIPTKFHQNQTKGFEETVWTKFLMQIFQTRTTPPKIIKPECTTRNATYQSYKISSKSDKSFEETVQTKFSMQIFQSPITMPKRIEPEQGYDMQLMHNWEWYLSILQSFIEF